MSVHEYKTRLSFSHIGMKNVLNYTGLTSILQEAAGSHADSLGFGINNTDKTHLTWILLSWKIRILSTPKWNSEVTIKTWPREISKIHSYRDFEVYDANSNLVALATSKWVLINTDTHSIARITPEIANKYGLVKKSVFPEYTDPKLQEPESSTLTFEYKIGRRDIDVNHHVNNLYYLDFALESLPEDVCETNFENIEVFYKKEIKLGQKIKCFYSKVEQKHVITIKNEDLSVLHAIVTLY